MDDDAIRRLLNETCDAVRQALADDSAAGSGTWSDTGERPGQYRIDLVADAAALTVLNRAGVGILSEESGLHDPGNDLVVVMDPVDGSTNASRGIPWYATSLCAVDADGPRAALVVNLATGTGYEATRGGGATRDGHRIVPAKAKRINDSMLILNGYSPANLNWRQYRALGATALDLCSVADGTVDASIDCSEDALGPWDYLGAMLILEEAGASIVDYKGRDLVVLDHSARRTPVSACTATLLGEVLRARQEMISSEDG